MISISASSDQKTVSFFTNAKQLGTVRLALSFAAAWFGATSTKAIMDGYWKDGLSALWMIALPSTLTLLLVTLFVGKRVQNLPYVTQPEAIERSFGERGRLFLAWVIILASTTTVASQLVASRHLLKALLGEWGTPVLLGLYSIVILYSLLGGFFAVAFTDSLQCILMFIALASLGGFVLYQGIQHPDVFTHAWSNPVFTDAKSYWTLLPHPAEALSLTLVFALAWSIAPEMWQRMKACHSAKQAQYVSFLAMLFIVFLCAVVAGIGLSAEGIFQVFGFTPQGTPNVFLWLTQLLPFVAWQGLILLGFLSAVTSTMDSAMSVASQSFIVDVVQRFVWTNATWKELRWINYIFLPLQGFLSVLIAFRFDNILKVLWLSADLYACTMLTPVFAILFTTHPHKRAGLYAMAVGGLCVILTTLEQYTTFQLAFWPDYPFSTLCGIALAGLTYIVVSRLSKNVKLFSLRKQKQ